MTPISVPERDGAIDMHAHITPFNLPKSPAGEPRWPCMRHTSSSAATIYMGERPFRDLDSRSWDLTRRAEDMERDGISMQALSPMPELFSYWFEGANAEILADAINGDLAAQVTRASNRFVGLGTVPLQDPALAVRHLERIQKVFGLSGVEIGSNVNGVYLGDPRFDDFFAAAESLSTPIFVHAFHPTAAKPLNIDPLFDPFVGFPLDIAMTIASLVASGTLTRYPRLRIGFSHGGGSLAPIIHRLDVGWAKSSKVREKILVQPSKTVSMMFFDSNVYEPAYLKYICDKMAPGHVFLGTDYPYLIMQRDPLAFVMRAGLSREAIESLRWTAAEAFLGEG